MQFIKMNTGVDMPMIGLGLYKTRSYDEMKETMRHAYAEGYRLFDTAAMYMNEIELGRAIKDLTLPRDELFITTKVWNDAQRSGLVRESVEESLRRLQVESVDLLMLHWPVREKLQESWAVMEQLYHEGKTKAIAVANFLQKDLLELEKFATHMPAVNQIECHPRLNQRELVRFCQEKSIVVQAHSTLMRGRLLDNELLNAIAKDYGKTVTQVILRWHLQNQLAVIPKSTKAERLHENIDILDFQLNEVEMAAIDALDNGDRCCADPLNFDF